MRDALLKLFKAGHRAMPLDMLMRQLQQMQKLAAGLAQRDTVERALHWLSAHDENKICSYLPNPSMNGQWCVQCTF